MDAGIAATTHRPAGEGAKISRNGRRPAPDCYPEAMLIDAHAHVDRYEGEALERALEQIEELRVLTVAVAMEPSAWERSREIAGRSRWIVPTFGVHPWEAHRFADDLDALSRAVDASPMIGEIGLDRHWGEEPERYPLQERVLDFFLERAVTRGKIVNLHTKGAERQVLEALERHDVELAIVHWYSGPPELVPEFLELGCFFTVGIELGHSTCVHEIAEAIPRDRLLTETDNPGGWQWLTDHPGTPRLIVDVVRELAGLHDLPALELAAAVEDNFRRLLRRSATAAGDGPVTELIDRVDELASDSP